MEPPEAIHPPDSRFLVNIGFFLKDKLNVMGEDGEVTKSQCCYEQKIITRNSMQICDSYAEQLAYNTLHDDMDMNPEGAEKVKAQVARAIMSKMEMGRNNNPSLWTIFMEIRVECTIEISDEEAGQPSGKHGCDRLLERLADDDCAICCENFNSTDHIVVTTCHHTYHRICLFEWLKKYGQCLGDLSSSDCTPCLATAVERLKTVCGPAMAGDVYLAKCYARYWAAGYYPDNSPEHVDNSFESSCPKTSVLLGDQQLGGPVYSVPVRRRDATTANQNAANTQLPGFNESLDAITDKFTAKGFTQREMVALSGAHTGDGNLAPLDDSTSNTFDNVYFQGLINRRGLLHSDQVLFNGGATDSIVTTYSDDANTFSNDFANAMIKMGNLSPLTGAQGQVRLNCRSVN
ncbi:Cysteine-rich repeat secretory protein 15 [Nymphaea thermarum]|nr:Cysteine-rich repeat secretory protein 15 [Nymphaea thermarum]